VHNIKLDHSIASRKGNIDATIKNLDWYEKAKLSISAAQRPRTKSKSQKIGDTCEKFAVSSNRAEPRSAVFAVSDPKNKAGHGSLSGPVFTDVTHKLGVAVSGRGVPETPMRWRSYPRHQGTIDGESSSNSGRRWIRFLRELGSSDGSFAKIMRSLSATSVDIARP
jgi:hypothetical protein